MLVTKPAPNETREVSRARKLILCCYMKTPLPRRQATPLITEAFKWSCGDSLELDYLQPPWTLCWTASSTRNSKLALESYLAGL